MQGRNITRNTGFSERLSIRPDHKRYLHTDDETYAFMLRYGELKYLIYRNKDNTDQYLYNFKNDPNEYINLADDPACTQQLELMQVLLKKRLFETGYTGNILK